METEVQDCRRHWLDVCEAAIYERQKTQDSLIHYKFSAVLISENDPSITSFVQEKGKQYVDFFIFCFDTRGQVSKLCPLKCNAIKIKKEYDDYGFTYMKDCNDQLQCTYSLVTHLNP